MKALCFFGFLHWSKELLNTKDKAKERNRNLKRIKEVGTLVSQR